MTCNAVDVVYLAIEYVMAYLTVPTERTNTTAVCTSSFVEIPLIDMSLIHNTGTAVYFDNCNFLYNYI